MDFAFEFERASARLRVGGEIDRAGVETFSRELESAAGQAEERLVVDLTGVTFMDSSGIAVIVKVPRRCPDTDFIVLTSRPAFLALEVAGLTRRIWQNVEIRAPQITGSSRHP
jgi:anti-anti-sigma factor